MKLSFFAKDDFARQPVPLSERRSWIPLTLVWFALGTDIIAALIGASLATGQTVANAMIVVSVSSLILGLLGGLGSYVGSTTGLSTGLISQFAFGNIGGRIVTTFIAIVFFISFGVYVGAFGESFQHLLQSVFGINLSVSWAAVIGGAMMTITATIGYKAIERLSAISFPLMLFLLSGLAGTIIGTEAKGEWFFVEPAGGTTMTILAGISFILAGWAPIVVISPDIARWAKSPRDAFLSGFLGFLLGNFFMISLTVMMVRITGIENVIQIMLSLNWGILAITILVLAQWTTNDNLLYSSGLALSSLIRNTPKYILTLITGVVGAILAYFQLHNHLLTVFSITGVLIAPVASIYMVEFFLLNRHRFMFTFIQNKKIPSIYWTAIVSWIIASTVGLMTIPAADYGLELFELTGASSLDTFLVAGLVHFLLGKLAIRNESQEKGVTNA
ncbi:purine-cytosine permease family protein [Desmospora activa]|uniref:Cytosine permease n=1 Tax=Desmospora activa DSM 45169 TaxID=1121389 RepID=A0A2T4Z701_9BACL|nr:cytosine permease [Desmospora activa]PTM57640.1 cytosine permease [Desmospora activa DSM 45169]